MLVLKNQKFRFSIDRGGTFTDCYAETPNGKVIVHKKILVLKNHWNTELFFGTVGYIDDDTLQKIWYGYLYGQWKSNELNWIFLKWP